LVTIDDKFFILDYAAGIVNRQVDGV